MEPNCHHNGNGVHDVLLLVLPPPSPSKQRIEDRLIVRRAVATLFSKNLFKKIIRKTPALLEPCLPHIGDDGHSRDLLLPSSSPSSLTSPLAAAAPAAPKTFQERNTFHHNLYY